ncbi:MAG: hypothetical protein RLO12_23935 [Fulvivirga sp.]
MEIVYIFLVLALIITIIKYPKDVSKGVIGIMLLPFERIWDLFILITLPIKLIILFAEERLNVNYLTRYLSKNKSTSTYKTIGRKPISFSKFRKYIVINGEVTEIKKSINEAKRISPELNIEGLALTASETHSIIELPSIGFYGFNYLIQWLAEDFQSNEVYGFASNGRSKFLVLNDLNGENSLVSLTNTGKKFWLSMYDDLDKKQFLRLNDTLKVETSLTTDSLELLVKRLT